MRLPCLAAVLLQLNCLAFSSSLVRDDDSGRLPWCCKRSACLTSIIEVFQRQQVCIRTCPRGKILQRRRARLAGRNRHVKRQLHCAVKPRDFLCAWYRDLRERRVQTCTNSRTQAHMRTYECVCVCLCIHTHAKPRQHRPRTHAHR